MDLARAKPDGLTYASSGSGTSPHLTAELFKYMTGVRMVHVPYKGSTAAHPDLLGGQMKSCSTRWLRRSSSSRPASSAGS